MLLLLWYLVYLPCVQRVIVYFLNKYVRYKFKSNQTNPFTQ